MSQPKFDFDARAIREALTDLPETSAWESLAPPKLSEIYIPQMHNKALLEDVSIVEGMRGAGKSFWTAVLADDRARTLVADVANIQRLNKLIVKIGFGLGEDNVDFPTARRISSLMDQSCTADDIWRSVLLRHVLKALKKPLPFDDRVDAAALWVKANHDRADQCLAEYDREIALQDKVLLLLFDSLDRLAGDWGHIQKILSAALQLGLECRARRAIRFKFFLRPDMVEEDDEVWRFADSSKLLHSKENLAWRSNDLFGLILFHLANSEFSGPSFRKEVSNQTKVEWHEVNGSYSLPRSLTMGEQPLRDIVEALAGSWVGTTPKRGFTYSWIPTHLSDAKGRLSPRSIMLAFKHAARWTADRYDGYKNALHYEGIQQGVVEASKIRIREIKEDYPWVGPLLGALKDATVPLKLDELTGLWTDGRIKDSFDAAKQTQRLPPRRYSSNINRKENMQALVDDLVELAIIYRTEDGRINMPDIFRVGFGIKRKGGVKPPR